MARPLLTARCKCCYSRNFGCVNFDLSKYTKEEIEKAKSMEESMDNAESEYIRRFSLIISGYADLNLING